MKNYHGSRRQISTLKKGSYVTPYLEDAVVFAVPWDSRELVDNGGPGTRPPKKLRWKPGRKIPEDHPIYVYEVPGPTKPAATNTGAKYKWNRVTTLDSIVRPVKTIGSWKKELLVNEKTSSYRAGIKLAIFKNAKKNQMRDARSKTSKKLSNLITIRRRAGLL